MADGSALLSAAFIYPSMPEACRSPSFNAPAAAAAGQPPPPPAGRRHIIPILIG
jgi:hypothetical protein